MFAHSREDFKSCLYTSWLCLLKMGLRSQKRLGPQWEVAWDVEEPVRSGPKEEAAFCTGKLSISWVYLRAGDLV